METNKDYLARLLPLLRQPIPHSWRVQSFSKAKPVATVMAYIDSRDAQDVLDTYCDYGWHRKHQMLNDRLYCSIGIQMPDGSVMWREDCGTESNEDKEKGQASDAFKRAGVNWGIGRFLYSMKIQYIDTNEKKVQGNYPYCIDKQGNKIWDLTAHINGLNPNAPKAPEPVKKGVNHTAILQGAQSLENLVEIWKAIPKDDKPKFESIKDEMKEVLEQVKIIGDIKTLLALDSYTVELDKGKFKDNAKLKALIAKRQLELKG